MGIMWYTDLESKEGDSFMSMPLNTDPDPMMPQQISIPGSSQEMDFTEEAGTEGMPTEILC